MQTIYYKTGDETYKRMVKFWGHLFLINFLMLGRRYSRMWERQHD